MLRRRRIELLLALVISLGSVWVWQGWLRTRKLNEALTQATLRGDVARVTALARARPAEVATLYPRIVERYRSHPVVLNNVSYFYTDILHVRYHEALQMARRAVELRPSQGAYWDTLGWAYYRVGRLDEAAAAQRQALQLLGWNAELRYHMGAIYEAQGRPRAALTQYRTALSFDPQYTPARRALLRLD
jgi:Flp pilus assembly protein TadD